MGFTEAWLKYRHETFDFFSRFKGERKDFGIKFRIMVLLTQFRAGWRAL